jgi:hypothetical protein
MTAVMVVTDVTTEVPVIAGIKEYLLYFKRLFINYMRQPFLLFRLDV